MRRVFGLAVACACLCVAVPVEARDGTRFRAAVSRWLVDVRQDSFTGVRACSVRTRNNRLVATPLVLGMRLVGHRDMREAWIRVDGGRAMPWRDLLPELARLGVEIDGRDMAAPTDGWVWIPHSALAQARMVQLRWAPQKRVRQIDVTGVGAALDVARARGCGLANFVS
jgi:hypothetical protein